MVLDFKKFKFNIQTLTQIHSQHKHKNLIKIQIVEF